MSSEMSKALWITQADMIRGIIGSKDIIYFGIVKEVIGRGVVIVKPSVIEKEEDYFEVACVVINTASASCSIEIEAQEGDKVLVVSPKMYQNKMFQTDKKGTIVNEGAQGYNQFTGLAILMNQYQEGKYKNYVKVNKGIIEAKFADGKGEFNLGENGAVKYKNEKASIEVKDSGEIEIKNDKASVKVGADGNIVINTEGKYTIKNNVTDMKTILNDLVGLINGIQTTGTASAQTVSPTSQAQLQAWIGNELAQLLV